MHVDVRWLMSIHAVRFIGYYFLLLCRDAKLSCDFARPAGIGDIFVAITGLILIVSGVSLARFRALLFAWNTIGLVDILFVAFSALRIGLRDWSSMAPLRTLPLSLLPTFIVPLIIVSHILIFIRLAARERIRST